jgi:hypothetical protein
MKLLFVAVLTWMLLGSLALAFDKSQARAHCDKKWGDDFEMVSYCLDNQVEAGNALDILMSQNPSGTKGGRVIAACNEKWSKDYEMIHYCATNQFDAVDWLDEYAPSDVPPAVRGTIVANCDEEWEEDYEMVKYCIENQTKAWRKLQ